MGHFQGQSRQSQLQQANGDGSVQRIGGRSQKWNCIKYLISWIATLSKYTWVPDQGSCQSLHGVYRYDTWQIDEFKLLHNAVFLVLLLYLRFNMKHETYYMIWCSLICRPTKVCWSRLNNFYHLRSKYFPGSEEHASIPTVSDACQVLLYIYTMQFLVFTWESHIGRVETFSSHDCVDQGWILLISFLWFEFFTIQSGMKELSFFSCCHLTLPWLELPTFCRWAAQSLTESFLEHSKGLIRTPTLPMWPKFWERV